MMRRWQRGLRLRQPLDAVRRVRGLADRSGSVAATFGLGAVLLLGLIGGGVDYARLVSRRSELQSAVDAGVIAGGNALKLAASSIASVRGVTEETIRVNAHPAADRPFAVTVDVPTDKTSVFARAEETVRLAFGGFLGMGTRTVAAQAKVNVVGKMRLCMLTLDPAAAGAFNLQKNAQVTANGCSLYSDSQNAIGMVGGDNAMARADTICSAGGFLGLRANFAPSPQTGCPAIDDPLKDRAPPPIGACTTIPVSANKKGDTSKNEVNRDATLDPGTYCGGLRITKKAHVTLRPGVYVIKDGPLLVDQKGSVAGDGVAFYFTGDRGGLLFDKNSTVSLVAPTSGAMAGLLMSEDRAVSNPVDPTVILTALLKTEAVSDPAAGIGALVGGVVGTVGSTVDGVVGLLLPPTPTPPPLGQTKPMRIYRIISNNARTMLGTIYLPTGRVVVDADKPVADQSAYTVVVAQQVNLYEGPNLYLNANYDSTSVPVPKGVGPLGGTLVITQ